MLDDLWGGGDDDFAFPGRACYLVHAFHGLAGFGVQFLGIFARFFVFRFDVAGQIVLYFDADGVGFQSCAGRVVRAVDVVRYLVYVVGAVFPEAFEGECYCL